MKLHTVAQLSGAWLRCLPAVHGYHSWHLSELLIGFELHVLSSPCHLLSKWWSYQEPRCAQILAMFIHFQSFAPRTVQLTSKKPRQPVRMIAKRCAKGPPTAAFSLSTMAAKSATWKVPKVVGADQLVKHLDQLIAALDLDDVLDLPGLQRMTSIQKL